MFLLAGVAISGYVLVLLILRGGNPSMLLDIHALILILGGTFGSLLVICPPASLISTLSVIVRTLRPTQKDEELLTQITELAQTARRGGILALEGREREIRDPGLKKGIMLLLESADPAAIRSILEKETECISNSEKSAQDLLERLAAFAPGIGMVGTLVEIVMMLDRFSGMQSLAPQIAHSLLPVVYGAVFSYLLLYPIASRVKTSAEKKRKTRQLCIEGVLAIQGGEPPHLVEERLKAFLQ